MEQVEVGAIRQMGHLNMIWWNGVGEDMKCFWFVSTGCIGLEQMEESQLDTWVQLESAIEMVHVMHRTGTNGEAESAGYVGSTGKCH